MSRLIRSSQILELAIMMQNSHYGISLDDIMNEFECSKRTAQRMKAVIEEQFPFKFEEVENYNTRKKRWKLKKGTVNNMVQFTSEEIGTLKMLLQNESTNHVQQKILTNLIIKLEILTEQ